MFGKLWSCVKKMVSSVAGRIKNLFSRKQQPVSTCVVAIRNAPHCDVVQVLDGLTNVSIKWLRSDYAFHPFDMHVEGTDKLLYIDLSTIELNENEKPISFIRELIEPFNDPCCELGIPLYFEIIAEGVSLAV